MPVTNLYTPEVFYMPVIESPEKHEHGKAFAVWFRAAIQDIRTGDDPRNSDVARSLRVSATIVGVWLNDCYDRASARHKFPGRDLIDRVAAVYGADADAGRRTVGYAPRLPPEMVREFDPSDLPFFHSYSGMPQSKKAVFRQIAEEFEADAKTRSEGGRGK